MTPLDADSIPALRDLARRCAAARGNDPRFASATWIADRLGEGDLTCVGVWGPDSSLLAAASVAFQTGLRHELRASLQVDVDPAHSQLEPGLISWFEACAAAAVDPEDPRPWVLRIAFHGLRSVEAYEAAGFSHRSTELDLELPLAGLDPARADFPPHTTLEPWSNDSAGACYQVYREAFGARPRFPDWDQATWQGFFTGYPEFRPDLSFLVRVDAEPAGYLLSAVDPIDGEDVASVPQLGVHPAFRRRGIARAMLTAALHRYRAAGIPTAHIAVGEDNLPAQRLYLDLGFTPFDRRTVWTRSGP